MSESVQSLPGLIEKRMQDFVADLGHDELISSKGLMPYFMELVEKPVIKVIYDSTGRNQLRTSKILGIHRNTLRKKLEAYGLKLKPVGESSENLSMH